MNDDQLKNILERYNAPNPAEDLESRISAVVANRSRRSQSSLRQESPVGLGFWDWRLAAFALVLSVVMSIGFGWIRGRAAAGSLDEFAVGIADRGLL